MPDDADNHSTRRKTNQTNLRGGDNNGSKEGTQSRRLRRRQRRQRDSGTEKCGSDRQAGRKGSPSRRTGQLVRHSGRTEGRPDTEPQAVAGTRYQSNSGFTGLRRTRLRTRALNRRRTNQQRPQQMQRKAGRETARPSSLLYATPCNTFTTPCNTDNSAFSFA